MIVTVAGGSGFLGRALVASLIRKGHAVSVLTRRARGSGDVAWDPSGRAGGWARHVRDADVVVNLAGESIASGRWTANRKALLRTSRVVPTQALVREILASSRPPALVSGSAVGYYGTPGDAPLTESAAAGTDFLAALCREWEDTAAVAARNTRVVLLRTGVVLGASGGALPQMALPFRFFVGGPLGTGRQYVSWIHLDDWVAMTEWTMATAAVSGPINATAPNPVTSAELSRALGAALGRPAFVRTPALPLRLALGEMADAAILNGQRVLPSRALELGFAFKYPTIDAALDAVYRQPVAGQ